MGNIEHYVRCPRSICDKGLVFDTVNGIRQPPPYTCSICKGEGFVPSTAYQGVVSLDALLTEDAAQAAHEAYLTGDMRDALRAAFRAAGGQ